MTTLPTCLKCGKLILEYASTWQREKGNVCTCRPVCRQDTPMPPKDTRMPVQATETPKGPSDLEELYLSLLREYAPDLPKPLQQQMVIPDRGFKADFYWPAERLIIEIDGLVHRVKSRFASDAEKHNLYVLSGFTYLRFTGQMLRHDITRVIEWTRLGLERGKG